MSFPKYPAYKESGVEWIGKIPAGWGVAPLFSISTENREKNTGLKSSNTLSLSYGNIIERDKNNNFGLLPDSYETYQIVKFGDIIFRLTDLQNDKNSLRSAISRYNGIITSAYLSIKTSKNCCPFYISYLMRAYDCEKVFYSMGGGVRQSLNFKEFKYLPVILPPLPEQQAIARFLDHECGKIDALIAEQERLIALLAEKRQAVISHAVTKGLNPIPPMKDSGVEWIGEIPVGWEVKSLRFALSDIFNGSTAAQVEPSDDTVAVTRIETISNGQINLKKVGYINKIESEKRKFLKNGDIIFSNINSLKMIGNCAIFYGDYLLHSGMNLITLRPNSSMCPKFILYVLKSTLCREEIESRAKPAINQASISQQSICDIKIPDIPLLEQQAIASFLDRECGKIDALIEEQKTMLALCKERRAALISAAVTGKIDVRAQSKAITA